MIMIPSPTLSPDSKSFVKCIAKAFLKDTGNWYAKQKHLGCKKVQGQSEATLQTGRRDQKVCS